MRLTDKFSDKYNEPLIFEEWAARHGVIYSLEDEHGLRGSFDECVATMLREGTHRQVHSRLLSQQLGSVTARIAAAANPAKDDEEPAAAEVCGDAWAAAGGCYAEAAPLVSQRLEVWWEMPDATDSWQAGVAKSCSRSRGLLIEYDDGMRRYHMDISSATENDVWRVAFVCESAQYSAVGVR